MYERANYKKEIIKYGQILYGVWYLLPLSNNERNTISKLNAKNFRKTQMNAEMDTIHKNEIRDIVRCVFEFKPSENAQIQSKNSTVSILPIFLNLPSLSIRCCFSFLFLFFFSCSVQKHLASCVVCAWFIISFLNGYSKQNI